MKVGVSGWLWIDEWREEKKISGWEGIAKWVGVEWGPSRWEDGGLGLNKRRLGNSADEWVGWKLEMARWWFLWPGNHFVALLCFGPLLYLPPVIVSFIQLLFFFFLLFFILENMIRIKFIYLFFNDLCFVQATWIVTCKDGLIGYSYSMKYIYIYSFIENVEN